MFLATMYMTSQSEKPMELRTSWRWDFASCFSLLYLSLVASALLLLSLYFTGGSTHWSRCQFLSGTRQ